MKRKSVMCTLLAALTLTLTFTCGCSDNKSSDQSSKAQESASVVSESEKSQSTESTANDDTSIQASEPSEASTENSNQNSSGITPTLWKAENAEGNYIYMMGSIHVGDELTSYMPDYVENAYNYSDALAVEADVNEVMNDASKLLELSNRMMYTDGTTIRDHISEETYNGIVELLKENNSYSPLYDYYVPFFWQSLLTNITANDIGLTTDQGVDMVFLDRAKKDNKSIYEIESLDYQMDVFLSFSDGLNELMLKEYLVPDAIEKQNQRTKDLYENWKKGTLYETLSISDTFSDPKEEYTEYYKEYSDKSLYQRNPHMAQKAEEYIDNGEKVFVLVGLLHFCGEGGIVDIMEKDGYTVTKVN